MSRVIGMAELLDLRPSKARARQLFPPGHPVREALIREADLQPYGEGIAKLETYVRLLRLLERRG